MFNPIIEFVSLVEMLTKKPKVEIELHPVIAKTKVEKGFINLESYKPFRCYYSSIHFSTIIVNLLSLPFLLVLLHQINNFLA